MNFEIGKLYTAQDTYLEFTGAEHSTLWFRHVGGPNPFLTVDGLVPFDLELRLNPMI